VIGLVDWFFQGSRTKTWSRIIVTLPTSYRDFGQSKNNDKESLLLLGISSRTLF